MTIGLLARMAREAGGNQNEFDAAADFIDQAIAEQTVTGGGLKGVAHNEAELAANPKHFLSDTVAFRSKDRTLDNKALNPLSKAWDTGLYGVVEGFAGMAELIGHTAGVEELENWGEALKEDTQYKIGSMPEFITSYKQVDDIGSSIEYISNLAAMSLPYMALSIGGALAAPATGGLSLAAPAAIYGGQVWNEMGDTDEAEKNAAVAVGAGISMAVLDRLGLQGFANASLLTKEGRNKVIAAAAEKGIPAEQVHHLTRLESAKLLGDASQFAKDQIQAGNVAKSFLQSAAVGSATEGLTEVGQEAIAALAAYKGSDSVVWDWNDFNERLIEAAIGGGVLGGAFSVPVTAYDVGQWTDVAYRTAPADANLIAEQNLWAEEEVAKHGRVRNHKDLLAAAKAQDVDFAEDIEERAARSQGGQWYKSFDGLMQSLPGFWRGSVRHTINEQNQRDSGALRELASLFGGNLYQTFGGASFEADKHLKLAEYKNLIDTPSKTLEKFGFTNDVTGQANFSKLVYGAYATAKKKENGQVDWDSLAGTEYEQNIPQLKALSQQLKGFTDKLHADQVAHNPDLGYEVDYALTARTLDKIKIEKDKQGFINDLISSFKVKPEEARQLVDDILNINSINDIDEAFSLVKHGGFHPTTHKSRTLNLSKQPEFAAKWLQDNLFQNLSNQAKSAARYTAYSDFLGPGNKVLNNLLARAELELAEKMPAERAKMEVDRIAKGMKDFLDAESGNYKRPTSTFGKNALAVQKNLALYTTLIGLPLATISSMVEFAMIYRGLDRPTLKKISDVAFEESKAFAKNLVKTVDHEEGTLGRQTLKDLGFFDWEVGAATVTGVAETRHVQQQMLQKFFTVIGLKQWTDYTRALRGAMATDYMVAHLETYANADRNNLTNEEVQARDALRNLGMDPERLVQLNNESATRQLNEEENAELTEMMRTGTFNFINDAIVLPQTANRPLFYNDPRFALFTQFHGFISTFQANILPKMYGDLFKGQTPSIKYNAFSIMATMIMLGFLSQYLKDLLKFGTATPYLDTPEKIQRAVGASGLLGVAERGLNVVNPIYENRYDNSITWLADTIAGESAAISTAQRIGDAVGTAFDGNVERTAKKLSKVTPLIGPVGPRVVDAINWEE